MITNLGTDPGFKLYPAPQRPSDSLPLAAARCYLVKTRGAARRLCSARPSQPPGTPHRARTLGPRTCARDDGDTGQQTSRPINSDQNMCHFDVYGCYIQIQIITDHCIVDIISS